MQTIRMRSRQSPGELRERETKVRAQMGGGHEGIHLFLDLLALCGLRIEHREVFMHRLAHAAALLL